MATATQSAMTYGDQRRRKEAMDLMVMDIAQGDDDTMTQSIRDALERGWGFSFMDSLSGALKKKEADIDRLCSRHYLEFLQSIHDMIAMNGCTSELSEKVEELHAELQPTGAELVSVLSSLDDLNTHTNALHRLLDAVLMCKDIAEQAHHTHQCLHGDAATGVVIDHYEAMRAIESLQKLASAASSSSSSTQSSSSSSSSSSITTTANMTTNTTIATMVASSSSSSLSSSSVTVNAVPPLACFLQTWINGAISSLLGTVRLEADMCMNEVRKDISLIGRTVLRRQARLSTAEAKVRFEAVQTSGNINSSGYMDVATSNASSSFLASPSSPTSPTSLPPSAAATTTKFVTTTSLQHVERYGNLFRLERWAKRSEFEDLVPESFAQSPEEEGERILSGLLRRFAPVHKALHMHNVLGESAAFHSHYQEQREKVVREIIINADDMAGNFGLFYAVPYLTSSLVGVLTIESVLRRAIRDKSSSPSPSTAFSMTSLSSLWESLICPSLSAMMDRYSPSLPTPQQTLLTKEDLLLLADVVSDEAIGLRSYPLYEIIRSLWDKFEEVQTESIQRACLMAFEVSSFQPMYVQQEDVFLTKIRAYHLDVLEYDVTSSSLNSLSSPIPASLAASKAGGGMNADTLGPIAGMKLTAVDREKQAISMTTAMANLDALEDEVGLGLSLSSTSAPLTASTSASMNSTHDHNQQQHTTHPQGHPPHSNSNLPSYSHTFIAQTFPFSETVCLVMHELHVLLVRYALFSVRNVLLGARGEAMCLAVEKAFDVICETFEKELLRDGMDTPLSKACQISIDSTTFALASDTLWIIIEKILSHFHWAESIDTDLPRSISHAKIGLAKVCSHAQDVIFKLLTRKIDDLLSSLVFIPTLPSFISHTPHPEIEELISFLQVTFMCLTNLPRSIREAAYVASCQHVGTSLVSFLSSDKVPQLNALCLANFEADVKRLESFASSCGVPNLATCFGPMKSLIKAVLHPDLPHFGDNISLMHKHFPRLNPVNLANILDKLQPTPITSDSSVPRFDKSATKALVKKLRAHQQAGVANR